MGRKKEEMTRKIKREWTGKKGEWIGKKRWNKNIEIRMPRI